MRTVINVVGMVVSLWLVACLERAIGLPVLVLVLGIEWALPLADATRYLWLLYVALLVAVLFQVSALIAFGVGWGVWLWLREGERVVRSRTVRLVSGILVGSGVIGWVMPGKIAMGSAVYALVVLLLVVLNMRRRRLVVSYKKVR